MKLKVEPVEEREYAPIKAKRLYEWHGDLIDLQGLVERFSTSSHILVDSDGFEHRSIPRVTPKQVIIKALEQHPGVSLEELFGSGRTRIVVAARHAAIYALHLARPDMSSPRIAKVFKKDHTSVLHAIDACKAAMGDKDAQARLEIKRNRAKEGYKRYKSK